MNKLWLIPALCMPLMAAQCEPDSTTPVKDTEAAKAAAAANSVHFTENAEIDNIKRRLELTSQPGLLGFIAVINMSGAPVLYTCVKGKVTSGSKRLTKPWEWQSNGSNYSNVDAPSDEGTYGSSSPYVYWWTCGGQYLQTDGNYIYSDKPFRLTAQPMIAVDQATLDAQTKAAP